MLPGRLAYVLSIPAILIKCVLSYLSLFCFTPSYESDHKSTVSKHNEGQIPGGKESIENYQYNIRYSVPFKYARHFARGVQPMNFYEKQLNWLPIDFLMHFFELVL